ncbi:MAG: thioredoxin family protein [Synergistaceae bacterium]|nr:thioredoxin family protein [Synergistaceae bacterium]
MLTVRTITSENFERTVIQQEIKMLIDFGTEANPKCRKVRSIMDQIDRERGDIIVGRVDIDKHPEIAARLSISVNPTIVAMRCGRIIGMLTGEQPKEIIESLLGL